MASSVRKPKYLTFSLAATAQSFYGDSAKRASRWERHLTNCSNAMTYFPRIFFIHVTRIASSGLLFQFLTQRTSNDRATDYPKQYLQMAARALQGLELLFYRRRSTVQPA